MRAGHVPRAIAGVVAAAALAPAQSPPAVSRLIASSTPAPWRMIALTARTRPTGSRDC
jgi:hypothetical protein